MSEPVPEPGSTIGGHRLDAPLGEGAVGLVFAATSEEGERVAVKLLRPELARDAVALARFEREARLARGLTTAHVVPILGLGESRGLTFLVMPYYRGGSLSARLRALGRLSVDETIDLAAQLGKGPRRAARAGNHPPRREARTCSSTARAPPR